MYVVFIKINNEELSFNAVPFYFISAYIDAVHSTGNLSSYILLINLQSHPYLTERMLFFITDCRHH